MDIHQHIKLNKEILDDPQISSQRRRHIESELNDLEIYRGNHPNDPHDPTSLELFCDQNPDSLECRIYND
jgi:CP12 domain